MPDDERKEYDCTSDLLDWKNKPETRSGSTVLKMRAFRILGYPQRYPSAFKELCILCEQWADEDPLVKPNPNQEALVSDRLVHNHSEEKPFKVRAKELGFLSKEWFVGIGVILGGAVIIIVLLLWMLVSFFGHGSLIG